MEAVSVRCFRSVTGPAGFPGNSVRSRMTDAGDIPPLLEAPRRFGKPRHLRHVLIGDPHLAVSFTKVRWAPASVLRTGNRQSITCASHPFPLETPGMYPQVWAC